MGEGQMVIVQVIGTLSVSTTGKTSHDVVMKAVLYVPTMICHLISVSKARTSGFRVFFNSDDDNEGYCHIIDKSTDSIYIEAPETEEGLYPARVTRYVKQTALVNTNRDIRHKRMAHVSDSTLHQTMSMVHGMDIPQPSNIEDKKCVSCCLSKSCRSHRPPSSEESSHSTAPLDLVHADIVGPIQATSLSGKKYFIPLYDDSSGISLARFLITKDAAGAAIKEMITTLESQRQKRVTNLQITCFDTETVKRLRTDNA